MRAVCYLDWFVFLIVTFISHCDFFVRLACVVPVHVPLQMVQMPPLQLLYPSLTWDMIVGGYGLDETHSRTTTESIVAKREWAHPYQTTNASARSLSKARKRGKNGKKGINENDDFVPAHKFACTVAKCGKTFTRSFSLNRHMKRHTNTRNRICQVCGDRFAEKSTLTV